MGNILQETGRLCIDFGIPSHEVKALLIEIFLQTFLKGTVQASFRAKAQLLPHVKVDVIQCINCVNDPGSKALKLTQGLLSCFSSFQTCSLFSCSKVSTGASSHMQVMHWPSASRKVFIAFVEKRKRKTQASVIIKTNVRVIYFCCPVFFGWKGKWFSPEAHCTILHRMRLAFQFADTNGERVWLPAVTQGNKTSFFSKLFRLHWNKKTWLLR